MSLGARLGGPATRRRRHLRFALLLAVLLAIAAVLVFFVDDEAPGEDFVAAANAECAAFTERLTDEYALSFPEGAPNDEAVAEYLSRAFADTMDELVAALRAIEGSDAAAGAIDALAARIAEVRAGPLPFATGDRQLGEGVTERFDDLGLDACSSAIPTSRS